MNSRLVGFDILNINYENMNNLYKNITSNNASNDKIL